MARAGQPARNDGRGLDARISAGALAKVFPRALVEGVIHAAGAREQRKPVLPTWLTLWFVPALALFMDRGAAPAIRKLAGVLGWAERGAAVLSALGCGAVQCPGAAGCVAGAAAVCEGGWVHRAGRVAGVVVAGAATGVAGRLVAGRAG